MNLKTELVGIANSPGRENYLHLLRPFESSRRKQFQFLNFEPNLFAQLASQCFFGLFTFFHETAGHSPTRAGTKAVFE